MTMFAPVPLEPATVLVMITLLPAATALKSGEEMCDWIAVAIAEAAAPPELPDGMVKAPLITETPAIVMLLMVPPLGFTTPTVICPSFGTAANVPVWLLVVPRCLAWTKLPIFLRWQVCRVPASEHQRTPENVCEA